MPARHTSPGTICSSEPINIQGLWSTKEGVGETSGQTAGSHLEGVRSLLAGPAEETGFLRSVRISPEIRNFTGPLARNEIWS